MFSEIKKQVNFSGSEYLEYMRYKDSRRFRPTKNQMMGIIYLSIAGGLFVLLSVLIYNWTYTPVPAEPTTWDSILKMLALFAGFGWIIHGTGFFLFRR